MSTLKVDAIRDNGAGFNDVVTFANSGGTENGKLCRAWVNFNGTGTVAIRASFNVNSITDNAVGRYQVNFSSSLSDANYCATSMVAIVSSETSDTPRFMGIRGTATMTTSSFRVIVGNDVGGIDDPHTACISVFR